MAEIIYFGTNGCSWHSPIGIDKTLTGAEYKMWCECDNKSYSDHARNFIGWCDTPYGYMMVCECKKCFTKYRFHGTIGGRFDFKRFSFDFMMRFKMGKEE